MSGFGGGFGGFGQNNQQQQSGFGGFGSNAANTGFGATGNTGFGATNTTPSLFGGTGTTGGFGSGGFGANTNSAFGAKPSGFGTTATTTGGGLFGNNTATAGTSAFGGGGFGATNTSSPFGGGTTGGSLFGASKPAFGAAATTTSAFGGGATSSPFGGAATTGAFGAPASTALTGAGVGDCQGTGSVPFQAFVEKEPNSSTNQQNAFQSICFQQPYQKFSPEELRLADYNGGRRYGNASNQAGAFGQTNFGGFGATTGGTGFGATNNTTAGSSLFGGGATTGFGAAQPASTGFGTNTATTGGLFGAKPATGGLFGAQPAAQTGGLFGNTGTTGGFGSSTTGGFGQTSAQPTTSLFGTNNAAKPGGFSFGQTQPAATATGFGAAAPATSAFGGGGLFGNTQQQQPAATGFGAQPAATSNPFGGFGGNNQQQTGTTSLFGGANQQKPATGLFGNPPAATGTGGGLFGGAQPAANTNLFGGANNNQTGGLFGNKPATTGTGGLFGNTATQPQTGGGGLFGSSFGAQNQNQPQQQNTGGGLFGSLNNNQPKPSLFGSTGNQQQSTGLFGNSTTNQQQGGGLFGSSLNNNQQQQQQPQNSLFGSMLGGSQQQQQGPQLLNASISDPSAYGTSSMFSNLGTTQISNPGPLATPLSTTTKLKKNAALPMYKLHSPSASRFSTPTTQKRAGYGFSYSTYGTPGSASSSVSTPGGPFTSSLLGGGSYGRSLSKSVSTSSLRRSFNTEDSILAPGAFSSNSNVRQFGSTGNVKKLTISRNIRQDLFSPPNSQNQPSSSSPLSGILKKRVSFSKDADNGAGLSSPLKQVNGAAPDSESLGFMRPKSGMNGVRSNGNTTPPEMEQVSNSNNQLAIVNENEASNSQSAPANDAVSRQDKQPGEYWMQPTMQEIRSMNRAQLASIPNFVVGRNGIGKIEFLGNADLTGINLDELLGGVIILEIRTATVYPDAAKKPSRGKGLNLPSIISLENSWPRKKDGKTPLEEVNGVRNKKHLDRLRRVPDTKFVSYDEHNGVWSFEVPHFTTYGLSDEEDEMDESEFGQSTLSPPPDTPTPKARTPSSAQMDQSFASTSQFTQSDSEPEDTFDFKKRKLLPGSFDAEDIYVDEDTEGQFTVQNEEESFLDERSVGSQSEVGVDEPMEQDDVYEDDESVSIMDQEMAGSYPEADNTAELEMDSQNEDSMMETPGAIMRARVRAEQNTGTPRKFTAVNDWTATLRTTISPQKQDRALLKSLIDPLGNEALPEPEASPSGRRAVSDGRGFATSIDLMNSLFGQARSPVKATKAVKAPASSKGFEWPYAKKPKTGDHDTSNMNTKERAFHDSMKPTWGPDGTLVYAAPSNPQRFGKSSRRASEREGLLTMGKGCIVSESRDIRFAKFSNEASAEFLTKQKSFTVIDIPNGIPYAHLPAEFSYLDFCDKDAAKDPAANHEKLVWELASILWDAIDVEPELFDVEGIANRLRKDKLSDFWQKLVEESSSKHIALAKSAEEKAIACLSGHRIGEACGHLARSKNFHLATLVALIGSKDKMRVEMRTQLGDWRRTRILSEFSQPIRAIYEMLAGNVCVCDGLKANGVEDRIDTFSVSKRFGLDWRQAFGLRLWYKSLSTDTFEQAIEDFAHDLVNDREHAKPHAWYVEQKISPLWEDKSLDEREDLLWSLMKLNTFDDSDLADILCPEASQLSPLDFRLSWQLVQALSHSGIVRFTVAANTATSDRLTLSFASQLTNEGSWLDTVFVLLHLSDPDARVKCIKEHLARHAGRIGAEGSQSFTALTENLKIPKPWVWEAKALFMRSVEKNPRTEVECLIKAKLFNEAHRTFAKEVAPKAVVELDYDTLRDLLAGFRDQTGSISKWQLGGQIYLDFLELLDSKKREREIDAHVLERLLDGLPEISKESNHPGFMEMVAAETISGVVAKAVIDLGKKGGRTNLSKILRLPLTEDKYLKHTVELSLEYYRGVMAAKAK